MEMKVDVEADTSREKRNTQKYSQQNVDTVDNKEQRLATGMEKMADCLYCIHGNPQMAEGDGGGCRPELKEMGISG